MTAKELLELTRQLITKLPDQLTFLLLITFALLTIIQMSKLNYNPWTTILSTLGRLINKELFDKIDTIGNELTQTRQEFEDKTLGDTRRYILDFANACRNGRKHTRTQWEFVISEIDNYDLYIETHHLRNGVFNGEAKFLRRLFQKLLDNNEFLSE